MLSYNRWVEVDLDILAANYHAMREFLPHQTAIMAVVKNNAYGHGAVETAKLFQAEGVAMLAVTTLDEGVELRLAGIEIPILVFAPVLKDEADAFFKWDLTPSIGNTEGLFALAETAGSRQINCHLKVNTGMSRMGIEPNHAAELVDTATRFENIHITAVYSHFATALEADLNFAKKQLAVFRHVQEDIRALGGKELVYHICNSAVALRLPEARLQMVRLGSVLYGQCSFAEEFGLNIQNPWQVKAKVVAVRDLAAGQSVGYGRDFTAAKPMRIAILPIGYGDGFGADINARPITINSAIRTMARSVGKVALNKGMRGVYFGNIFLPVVGRIAMQATAIDITGTEIALGDIVNIPMRRTTASPRLPHLYIRGGQSIKAVSVCE